MSPTKSAKEAASKLAKYRLQDKEPQAEDGAGAEAEADRVASESKVLEAIALCQSTLTSKIEEIKVDISLIRHDMSTLRDRVKETEDRISSAEDVIHPMQHTTEQLQRQVQQLEAKHDDMENRLRRCNLRFIGLPEKAEGTDPAGFLETLLIDTYGREAFSGMFAVERAHRVPARPPPQGAPPRTFIAKFLNFRDRDKILRLARERGNMQYGNTNVAAFPDFSNEVQKQRQQYQEVKRRLRILHLKYSMLYPARLRVEEDGRTHFFNDSKSASEWLDQHAGLA